MIDYIIIFIAGLLSHWIIEDCFNFKFLKWMYHEKRNALIEGLIARFMAIAAIIFCLFIFQNI